MPVARKSKPPANLPKMALLKKAEVTHKSSSSIVLIISSSLSFLLSYLSLVVCWSSSFGEGRHLIRLLPPHIHRSRRDLVPCRASLISIVVSKKWTNSRSRRPTVAAPPFLDSSLCAQFFLVSVNSKSLTCLHVFSAFLGIGSPNSPSPSDVSSSLPPPSYLLPISL